MLVLSQAVAVRWTLMLELGPADCSEVDFDVSVGSANCCSEVDYELRVGSVSCCDVEFDVELGVDFDVRDVSVRFSQLL